MGKPSVDTVTNDRDKLIYTVRTYARQANLDNGAKSIYEAAVFRGMMPVTNVARLLDRPKMEDVHHFHNTVAEFARTCDMQDLGSNELNLIFETNGYAVARRVQFHIFALKKLPSFILYTNN